MDRKNYRYKKESSKYSYYKGLNHFYKKGKERYYKYPTYYRYRKAKPAPTRITTIPVPTTTVKYDKLDHKRRLRELLVPLPRHIAGPVPTFPSEVEETTVDSRSVADKFVCPTTFTTTFLQERNYQRERNWRAFPDPESCRHYYICVVPSQEPKGIRHSCQGDRIFNQVTETCEYNSGSSVCVSRREGNQVDSHPTVRKERTEKPAGAAGAAGAAGGGGGGGGGVDKQGLFVEFIQFLIKIGMFNEQVVMSMLSNKELFL